MIFDGPKSQSPMITKLCQSQTMVGVASSGQNLRIEMHSAPSKTSTDFRQMDTGRIFNEMPTRFHARYYARGMCINVLLSPQNYSRPHKEVSVIYMPLITKFVFDSFHVWITLYFFFIYRCE